MLDSLYEVNSFDMKPFASRWTGPDRLPYGEPVEVARYDALPDGADVQVLCTAMPARFYTLVTSGYTITTGSGMAAWVAQTALSISQGMVGVHPK